MTRTCIVSLRERSGTIGLHFRTAEQKGLVSRGEGKEHPGSGSEVRTMVLTVGAKNVSQNRLRRHLPKTRFQDRARVLDPPANLASRWQARVCRGSLSLLGMAAEKAEADLERLRILVSDGKGHRLEEVTHTVTSLGHEVVAHSSLGEVAASTASIGPDAAIVIVRKSSEHALELIGRTVTEAACPVIAILDVEDEAFIRDAAKRGIFASSRWVGTHPRCRARSTWSCPGLPNTTAWRVRSPAGRSRSGPRAS
jgi:hypothetical protein